MKELRRGNLYNDLLHTALYQLTLGLIFLQQGEIQQACLRIDRAITGLRKAGTTHHLPRGLLACAALHRHTHDFTRARQDLQEVFDIAEPSGMRLHLTDYHLEMARLLLAEAGFDYAQPTNSGTPRCLSEVEGNMKLAQTHIDTAAELINATGYHRRDKELLDLQQALAKVNTP